MRQLFLIAVLLTASSASAQMPKWQNEANAITCAESFPERLEDAQQAVVRQQKEAAVYDRVMPWFNEHCRWLTDLEIAIRKIDDANAFVCDTSKGRPKGLTADLVLDHQARETTQAFQHFFNESLWCEAFDMAERSVTLVMRETYEPSVHTDKEVGRRIFAIEVGVMCWHDESEKCSKARAAIAPRLAKPDI